MKGKIVLNAIIFNNIFSFIIVFIGFNTILILCIFLKDLLELMLKKPSHNIGLKAMAKYVVQSRLWFARNSVVMESLRFRSLPLLQAENS